MRLTQVFLLMALLLLIGCGGGGGGGESATNDYTVPTSMDLTADYLTLAAGTATLTRTVGHFGSVPAASAGDNDQDLTSSVVLSSSNTAVALPVASMILAESPGTAIITATWTGTTGTVVETFLTVTVTSASVDMINVTPETATVSKGDTQAFVATADFDDATAQTLIRDVVWTSDDTSIATVDSSGVATGQGPGAIAITASFGGKLDSAILTVPAILESISLSATPAHIFVGDTVQFTATGNYSDGSTDDQTENAFWDTDGGLSTAIISNATGSKGQLTGLNAAGNLTVTASISGFVATYPLAIFSP